jgi:hypothetical protein
MVVWQAQARQAVGIYRGAVGKPRTRRAVHRPVLWAGGLSTADAFVTTSQRPPIQLQWVNSSEQKWVSFFERQSQELHHVQN